MTIPYTCLSRESSAQCQLKWWLERKQELAVDNFKRQLAERLKE